MRLFALSLCLVAASAGLRTSAAPQVYEIPLRGGNGTGLYWRVDYRARAVGLEVHAYLPKDSWLGVGFSDRGDLRSADLCVFWTDWRRRAHLEDVWTSEDGRITLDESQDCRHFRYTLTDGRLKLFFERDFDTCDPRDYVIQDGTTHVVWAQGPGPLYRLDGVSILSATSSGFERTQLLKNEDVRQSRPPDTWALDIRADRVEVPGVETTYWCHVHELPGALERRHHVIEYGPVIEEGNEELVHHMEVFHCEGEGGEEVPRYVGSCFDERRPRETQRCKRVVAAWAMGAKSFSYPEEAGLPVGGGGFGRFVMLEVHYNNPELRTGRVDSSGIRFLLTPSLRKHDAGVMELGLEYTDKMAIPPGQRAFQLSGDCVRECTAVGLPEQGIVVFGSQLHTHLLGTRVHTRHVRNGLELAELNGDDHYSTHFQEIRRLKRSVRVLPGDALVTTCTYQTDLIPNVTLGGFSITDEMCVNYIHYYPKTNLEVCKSSIAYDHLFAYFDYLRTYEDQNTSPHNPISTNYRAIHWTPARAELLRDLYAHSALSMQCNQSSGQRYPGDWEGLPPTHIRLPLPPTPPCHPR